MAAIYHRASAKTANHGAGTPGGKWRERVLAIGVILILLAVAVRLGKLQLVQGKFYSLLSKGQHELFDKLLPERGQILVRERNSDSLYPVATNKDLWIVYSDNRSRDNHNVFNPASEAKVLAPLLATPIDAKDKKPEEIASLARQNLADKEKDLAARLGNANSPYAPLAHGVDDGLMATIKNFDFPNINFAPEKARYYPEKDFGGQLLGFVGYKSDAKTGLYGLEGYWNTELSGTQGYLTVSRDPSGNALAGDGMLNAKRDGSNIVLTIDRTLQAFVCDRLKAAVAAHKADGGSVVMMDPQSGAVLAMCGAPDYDPNTYNKTADPAAFNIPSIWDAYEPGSVMKAVTMAGALDSGVVTPNTTYNDTGEEKYGTQIIRNSDHQAHGTQTMIEVLDKSLNTGAIFAMRATGIDKYKAYLKSFGFGTRTGIELDTESPGNISSLKNRGEVDAAAASFGQGITATPIQIAVAYAAIANGGKIVKPYIVDSIVHPDGTTVKTQPRVISQVVSDRAASLLTGMLVSVVKNGHGKRAAVPGYLVAGKTGTAQIPKNDGTGYDSDPFATNGTFAGFAPVSAPRFVMIVRMIRPKDVQFAESSAAPLFGEIASYALKYLEVAPDDAH